MSTAPPSIATALEPLRARWRALAARERLAVTIAALLVGALLVWTIGVRPALATLNTAPAQLDALDAQLQQMQRVDRPVSEGLRSGDHFPDHGSVE